MAIAALSVNNGRTARRPVRVVRTAMQFACGHILTLGVGVVVALTSGWMLPAAFVGGAERVGGALLVVLGGAGLWSTLTGTAYGHIHTEHDGRPRWHLHFGAGHAHATHAHSSVPTLMGAVFALSSLRAIVLLAPMGASLTAMALPTVLLLVLLFGLGILLSMSLFGVVLARALSMRAVSLLGRTAAGLVATTSVLLGTYWVIA